MKNSVYTDNLATINILDDVTKMLHHIEFSDLKNIILTLRQLKKDIDILDEIIHDNISMNLYN